MKKIMVLCVALLCVACESIDPYTGESKTNNTTKGAGIGAVVGAAVGAIINHDDREKGALAGAVAGGAIGGGVGYYMDQQEAALRQQLQGSGVQVVRDGDNIRLVMPGNITFATGSYDIRPRFFDVLNSVALVVKKFNKTTIQVSGHTDSTGSSSLNQRLSERRASSVGRYLIVQKVARGRVSTVGYSFRYPIASNKTASGREQNRRVELQLVPIQQQ